jgi:hypothetical protein
MTDVSNPAEQADNTSIESALKEAVNTFNASIPPVTPFVSKPMSTDPIPPVHHLNLIDNIADITDYINEQTQKHKELMIHIDSLREKLGSVSSDMKSYHVEDKFATVKKIVAAEKKFFNLTTAHKIEIVVVALIFVGIVISAFKFL